MGQGQFNDRQELFIEWYVKLLNGYQAARRAGYTGNRHTLDQTAYELLRNPEIRAEIDRRIKASIPSAETVMSRVSARAHMDITEYTREDGTLDVQALAAAGLGHLVTGIKPGRNGLEVTLVDPQKASNLLARYHRVGSELSLDLNVNAKLDQGALDSLVNQIAAASRAASDPSDDTQDSDT